MLCAGFGEKGAQRDAAVVGDPAEVCQASAANTILSGHRTAYRDAEEELRAWVQRGGNLLSHGKILIVCRV